MSRRWADIVEGEAIGTLDFPLSLYRMVMAAGATRDFNAIHHNSEFAKATGAPDLYANTIFLLGMWERALRDYIGDAGEIRRIGGFRMVRFNTVGETVTVSGHVVRKWLDGSDGLVEIELRSEHDGHVSVGPGLAVVRLPPS